MGFRLGIIKESNYDKENESPIEQYDFYGTKYFGYVDDDIAINSESYRYLKSINKCPYDDEFFHFWEEGQTEHIKLTRDEFVKFISLYSNDYGKFTDCNKEGFNLMNDVRIKDLLNSNESVYIDWG